MLALSGTPALQTLLHLIVVDIEFTRNGRWRRAGADRSPAADPRLSGAGARLGWAQGRAAACGAAAKARLRSVEVEGGRLAPASTASRWGLAPPWRGGAMAWRVLSCTVRRSSTRRIRGACGTAAKGGRWAATGANGEASARVGRDVREGRDARRCEKLRPTSMDFAELSRNFRLLFRMSEDFWRALALYGKIIFSRVFCPNRYCAQ